MHGRVGMTFKFTFIRVDRTTLQLPKRIFAE